jgi:hypothetical protein
MAESKSAALPLGYAPTGIAFYAQPRGVSRRANPSPTGERGVNIGAKSNTSMAPLRINVQQRSTSGTWASNAYSPLATSRWARHDCWIGPSFRSRVRSAIARRQIRADLAARANVAAATFDRVAWPVRCPVPRCRCGAAHRAPSCWKARRRPWLSPRAPGSAALGVNAIASARANRLAAGAQPLLLSNFFQLHPSNFAPCGGHPMPSAGLTATWLRGAAAAAAQTCRGSAFRCVQSGIGPFSAGRAEGVARTEPRARPLRLRHDKEHSGHRRLSATPWLFGTPIGAGWRMRRLLCGTEHAYAARHAGAMETGGAVGQRCQRR